MYTEETREKIERVLRIIEDCCTNGESMAHAKALHDQLQEKDPDPYLPSFETLRRKNRGWSIDENVPSKIRVNNKQLVTIDAFPATVKRYRRECGLPSDQLHSTESLREFEENFCEKHNVNIGNLRFLHSSLEEIKRAEAKKQCQYLPNMSNEENIVTHGDSSIEFYKLNITLNQQQMLVEGTAKGKWAVPYSVYPLTHFLQSFCFPFAIAGLCHLC